MRSSKLDPILALCAAMAVAAMAGCGGEDDDALTKSEFVAQANSICRKSEGEVLQRLSTYVKEQPNEGAGQTQNELFAGAVDDILIPAAETKIRDIESLDPPPAGEKRVDAYLGAMERGVDAVETKGPTYVALNASLYEFEKQFAPAARIAGDYGLKDCR